MREGAKWPPRAVAGVLDVVALGGLVDLRVELLLRARVAVLAAVARLAAHGVAPLVAGLDLRAWGRPGGEGEEGENRGNLVGHLKMLTQLKLRVEDYH